MGKETMLLERIVAGDGSFTEQDERAFFELENYYDNEMVHYNHSPDGMDRFAYHCLCALYSLQKGQSIRIF